MTGTTKAEIEYQIMLVERERLSNLLDTVSRFGHSCPVCAISQSLCEFRCNLGVPSGCEMNCPSYERCRTFIRERSHFAHKLAELEIEVSRKIREYEGEPNDEH